MKTYYNTKKERFEEQKTATKSASKILITKDILDSNIVSTYTNGAGNEVRVALINGHKFAFVKVDELVNDWYATGGYRVSHGDLWNPDEEAFV